MTATGKIRKAELRAAISAGTYGPVGLPEVAIGRAAN
jgi:hypothetical protein